MPIFIPTAYHEPLHEKVVNAFDRQCGSRLPIGTKIVEYRTKVVYVYPSGKTFTRMKTLEERRMY